MKNENLKTGATETINLSLARYKLCEHMKVHQQSSSSAEIRLAISRLPVYVFYIKGGGADMWDCKARWWWLDVSCRCLDQKASKILTLLRRKLVVTSHNDYKFSSHLPITFNMHPAGWALPGPCSINDPGGKEMVGCHIYPPCLIVAIENNLSTLFSCFPPRDNYSRLGWMDANICN